MRWLILAAASFFLYRLIARRYGDERVAIGITGAFALVLGTAGNSGNAVQILGVTLYCSWFFVILWLVLWVPAAALIYFIATAHRRGAEMTAPRVHMVPLLVAIVIGSLPWWDVLYRTAGMTWLCHTQAGLRIYKTVEAEGFAGGAGIATAHELGFRFYEERVGDRVEHWTWDGARAVEERPDFEAKYEIGGGGPGTIISGKFRRTSRAYVRDRTTKEILGELVTIKSYPGIVDRKIMRALGAESVFWSCGDEAPPGAGVISASTKERVYELKDVIRATLKPAK